MPVAAAKIVETKSTAMYSEPRVEASMSCTDRNSRSMRPACSIMIPMKTKRGTAARVCSSITLLNWRVIR